MMDSFTLQVSRATGVMTGIWSMVSFCSSAAAFQRLSPANRSKAIRRLREQNLSLRQISRLTGTGITAVRRIAKEAQDSLLPATRI